MRFLAQSELRRVIKGQVDGVGSRPRLRAETAGGELASIVRSRPNRLPMCPRQSTRPGAWLREQHNLRADGCRPSRRARRPRVRSTGPGRSRTCSPNSSNMSPLAPLHQPSNLAPIRALLARFPQLPQVACFDTAFHRGHSAVVDHFAIPEQFYEEGVRRYGFHGLSYEFIAQRLRQVASDVAERRVIVAHLGSGASMCALANGRSIESTMGFTALDGLPMGTRPGQIDPGVVLYLIQQKGMTAAAVQDMLYRDSGLKGISGVSNDMRELEAQHAAIRETRNRLFCLPYRAPCRYACCCARRNRRFCVHRRHRREFCLAPRQGC